MHTEHTEHTVEEMASFFDTRADSYDAHMLVELQLEDFYACIARCFECVPLKRLLDLGCGTGLELERLFAQHAGLQVTGVDLSGNMLAKLREKFPGEALRTLQGSYFTVDFGTGYDAAVSTYSLHHFGKAEKRALYRKIRAALVPGAFFLFGDYTVPTEALEREFLERGEALRREKGIAEEEFLHYDTPFTAMTETGLLLDAGFETVEVVRSWENASVLLAR